MIGERGTVLKTGGCFSKKIWIFAAVLACTLFWTGKMTVLAEPASLESESAVIYEQMSAESNVVGNLVRGSSFELSGSVTAEDGSTWYSVSAFGIQGYIRGDAEFREGTDHGEDVPEQGAVPEEGITGQEADADAQAGAERAGQDGAGGTEAGTDRAEGTQTGDDTPEGEAPEEEGTEAEEGTSTEQPAAYQGNNTRDKTYALGSSGLRAEGRIDQTEGSKEKAIDKSGKNTGRINTAFICFIVVIAGSAVTALVSYKKIRKELKGSKVVKISQTELSKQDRTKKAANKKKRHRKKKGKTKKNGNAKKQQS